MTAAAAKMIELKTVSGTIHVSGSGGEVEVSTISGDVTLDLESITRGRFKSVSGNLTAGFALAADGRFEGESVSGNFDLRFAGTPAADFDVQSVSGSISNCFGPKPAQAQYGPGSRLAFKSGEGNAHVQVESKSGKVNLCTKDSQAAKDTKGKRTADAATDAGCGRPTLYETHQPEHGDRLQRFPLI